MIHTALLSRFLSLSYSSSLLLPYSPCLPLSFSLSLPACLFLFLLLSLYPSLFLSFSPTPPLSLSPTPLSLSVPACLFLSYSPSRLLSFSPIPSHSLLLPLSVSLFISPASPFCSKPIHQTLCQIIQWISNLSPIVTHSIIWNMKTNMYLDEDGTQIVSGTSRGSPWLFIVGR